MYNEIARGYDELYYQEQLDKLNIIKKHFKFQGKILDIGAGTGIISKHFENVTSVDPAEELLKQAKGKTVVAKAEKLPFPNNSFDTVVSLTALHHCDIDKAIKEIKRVSKAENYAFTILKKAKHFKEIVSKLKNNFNLKEIDEKKDLILISQTN
ncbi:class I SAM-dependent methyltransferase [archaeon]|jgi:ubiquinone/menaquinone biosynthesis C-methylase UbiE|nr:class I SAM-dependent methyltransferase [archaeon]MBT4417258.1 class I SAM-dependent methyltransferase [archaeon]